MADASRAVGVAQKLVNANSKKEFIAERREEYEGVRERNANRKAKALLSYKDACANPFDGKWDSYTPAAPVKTGITRYENFDLAELAEYIDWTPFFMSWELAGKFPRILEDEVVGEAATNLYKDARAMLQRIIDEKLFNAKAVVGIWPANRVGADDIKVFDADSHEELAILHHLRQQTDKPNSQPNYSLADYVAPEGTQDYIGGFVVTAGFEAEHLAKEFDANNDDYNSIMMKALADRLAEAFAERMHEIVRKELWGYAADESLSNEDLIKENYKGIRPAPGYPACPDHTEKETLFRLLDAEAATGVSLTESFAMTPAASVSGWYFAHPEAKYFGLGKIGKDQVEDIAARKGMDVETMERWLAPHLSYDR